MFETGAWKGGGGTERRKRAERNFRAPPNFKRENGCIIKMFDYRWCENFYELSTKLLPHKQKGRRKNARK